MLESLLKTWEELQKLLTERDEADRLTVIDKYLVEELLTVLLPFKEAILALEVSHFLFNPQKYDLVLHALFRRLNDHHCH
jgi:hypothetical protein